MQPNRRTTIIAGTLALTLVGAGAAYGLLARQAGPTGATTGITPIGYALTPAGQQTTLGDLPLNSALSPDGKHLLVSNDGQGQQSLQLIDAEDGDVLQTVGYARPESVYVGLAWSRDGRTAYASAAANSKIRVFTFDDGALAEGAPIPLPTRTPDGRPITLFPAGLALTPDDSKLVVADQLGDAVTVVDVVTKANQTVAIGHRPFWVTLSKDGRTAYASDQGADTLDVVDVSGSTPTVAGQVKVGLHPTKSVLSADGTRLFVANGDADSVSVVDTATNRTIQTIDVAPKGTDLVGSNPIGLALSEDERQLYVANSGNNAVAVVDLRQGRVRGVIPTGWYPSAVTVRDGTLLVTNAKGLGAGPNDGPGHPNPESRTPTSPDQYTGSMIKGTLSRIEVPGADELERYSETVADNNRPVKARGAVVPTKPGQHTPVKHVIYVVKENRTYDQVLGSLGKGNGEPSLNLFGDESAPNTRALARKFTTFDNFYADAEVSANGWNWVAQANSNPYAEQMWPANYSGRKAPYPSENATPEIAAQEPSKTFLWQRLAAKGIGFRNYGFYVDRDAATNAMVTEDPVLAAGTDPDYLGYDLSCPDSADSWPARASYCGMPRVQEWLKEFRGYETKGNLPTVQFVRLPNDHTAGTKAGFPTPKAYVADNDQALGQLVDAVSHSKYWRDTAIFVTEDDAQNGPDHVDAHRTLALVISPYTQTGKVDSTFYSTASMVRTIGLLAGSDPLTQFDDYSTPMSAAFVTKPDLAPYQAIRPSYPMTTVNGSNAPLAAVSSKQDLSKEDQIDEKTFNEAIWKSVKGAASPMPALQHQVFGRATGGLDTDD